MRDAGDVVTAVVSLIRHVQVPCRRPKKRGCVHILLILSTSFELSGRSKLIIFGSISVHIVVPSTHYCTGFLRIHNLHD
jgi:hypothetical protein